MQRHVRRTRSHAIRAPRALASVRRRAAVLIAVIVTLVLLEVIVIALTSLNTESQRQVPDRLNAAKALYAAEAGANMALAEIYSGSDRDGEGDVGTISNDGNAANSPSVAGVKFSVIPVTATSGNKYRITTQSGNALRRIEIVTDSTGADSFEGYPVGTLITDSSSWILGDVKPFKSAYPSTAFARSGAQSIDIQKSTDIVRMYAITSGTCTITAWVYIPSSTKGSDSYFILRNTYSPGGTQYSSTKIRFRLTQGTVDDNLAGATGTVTSQTLVRNQWVPIVATVNLTSNTQTVKYNGNTVLSGPWVRNGGTTSFVAIELDGGSAGPVYYDDIQVTQNGATSSVNMTNWELVAPTP